MQVSYHLFVDDMLIFCRANRSSLQGDNTLLQDLSLNTGLAINRAKSKKILSKGCQDKSTFSYVLGMVVAKSRVRYLGLPHSMPYRKAKHFTPLTDKVRNRIDG